MNVKYIILILCTICSQAANAQYKVQGNIVDSATKPVEFASVRALTSDSTFVTGTTATDKGIYCIELKNKGNYILQFSSIGYAPKQIQVDVDEPLTTVGDVTLEESSQTLSEVTVTADRITRVDNHLLIIPDKTSIKHAFSTYDLLNNLMLPGFDVNTHTGAVTLFNKDVAIYVDGIPADFNTVRNLRAKDVEKIEYHDVPTGRYSKDYAAINFVMRKYKFGGYANFDAQQCIGHLNGTYNGYAQFVKGNTQYHVTGGYSMWDMSRDVVNSSEKYMFPDNPVDRSNKNLGGRTTRHMEYGQIRINNSTQKRQFSVQASLTHNNSDKNRRRLQTYSAPYDIAEESFSKDKTEYITPAFNAFAYFNLPKKQWAQIYGQISYTRQKRNSLYATDDRSIPNGSEEDYIFAIASVGYGKTFRYNNTLYATVQEIFTTSSIDYSGSYSSWQHLWNSVIWAGGSYRHQIKKVSLNANVGVTITNMHVHNGERSSDVSPNMSIEAVYRPNQKQQLKGNFSIGLGTAPLSVLNDAEIQIDFLNARRGNPNLNQSSHRYGYSLDYSIQLGRFNAASNIRFGTQNNLIFAAYLFGDNKLIQTYANGDEHYFDSELGVSWNACKAFRMSVKGIYRHKEYRSFMNRTNDNFGGSLSAMAFWRDFMLSTSFHLPQETMSGWAIVKSPFKYSIDLNWNHKNWSVKAWVTNPFSHIRDKVTMNVPELKTYSETRKSRSAMVKVTYTFDFGKKVQHTGVDRVNTSTGSAVL